MQNVNNIPLTKLQKNLGNNVHLHYTLEPDNSMVRVVVDVRESPGSTMEAPREHWQHFNNNVVTTSLAISISLYQVQNIVKDTTTCPLHFVFMFWFCFESIIIKTENNLTRYKPTLIIKLFRLRISSPAKNGAAVDT